MTTNTDKSRIMHMARAIFDANHSLAWSDCMKRAWDFHWFRKMLAKGIVNFRYWKRNPELKSDDVPFPAPFILREARGTLLTDIIPEDKRPKGTTAYKPNFKNMAYYDLDREAWRSFDVNHFECIVRFIAS